MSVNIFKFDEIMTTSLKAVNRSKDCFKLSETIVFGSLKLTINLLTIELVIRVAYSLLLECSLTSFFGIKVCVFCVFLEKNKTVLRHIFFRV